MLRSTLLIALMAVATTAVTITTTPQVNERQQEFIDNWGNFVDDYDSIKNMFTEDAIIRVCPYPEPCEEKVGFDRAFGGFHPLFSELHFEAMPLLVENDILVMRCTDIVVTPKGCRSMFSGIGVATFNKQGMVTRYDWFSDNSHGFFECAEEMMEDDTTVEHEVTM